MLIRRYSWNLEIIEVDDDDYDNGGFRATVRAVERRERKHRWKSRVVALVDMFDFTSQWTLFLLLRYIPNLSITKSNRAPYHPH